MMALLWLPAFLALAVTAAAAMEVLTETWHTPWITRRARIMYVAGSVLAIVACTVGIAQVVGQALTEAGF